MTQDLPTVGSASFSFCTDAVRSVTANVEMCRVDQVKLRQAGRPKGLGTRELHTPDLGDVCVSLKCPWCAELSSRSGLLCCCVLQPFPGRGEADAHTNGEVLTKPSGGLSSTGSSSGAEQNNHGEKTFLCSSVLSLLLRNGAL